MWRFPGRFRGSCDGGGESLQQRGAKSNSLPIFSASLFLPPVIRCTPHLSQPSQSLESQPASRSISALTLYMSHSSVDAMMPHPFRETLAGQEFTMQLVALPSSTRTPDGCKKGPSAFFRLGLMLHIEAKILFRDRSRVQDSENPGKQYLLPARPVLLPGLILVGDMLRKLSDENVGV